MKGFTTGHHDRRAQTRLFDDAQDDITRGPGLIGALSLICLGVVAGFLWREAWESLRFVLGAIW